MLRRHLARVRPYASRDEKLSKVGLEGTERGHAGAPRRKRQTLLRERGQGGDSQGEEASRAVGAECGCRDVTSNVCAEDCGRSRGR